MKFRGTWLLLAASLALGGYIYFFEIKKVEQEEKAKEAEAKLFSLQEATINKIELVSKSGSFVLEKKDNGWQLISPTEDSADEPTVTGLLNALTSEKYDDFIDDENMDLKIYGLDAPKTWVALTSKDGKVEKLFVGDEGAVVGKLYLKKDGDKRVLFGPSNVKFQVEKSEKDLRNKKVVKASLANIQRIELDVKRKDVVTRATLEKGEKGWVISKPVNQKADEEMVRRLFESVENMRANDFGDSKKPLSQFGLDRPEVTVSFYEKEGKLVEQLLMGAKRDMNAFAKTKSEGTVYQIFASAVDPAALKLSDLRDKKGPLAFAKEEVSEIKFKNSLTDLSLLKKGADWVLPETDEKRSVSQVQVANLLERLQDLKVSEFLENESPKGLQPPRGSITLKNAKGETVLNLEWGEKTKSSKSYYVKTNKESKPFGVESIQIDGLPGQTLVESKGEKSEPVQAH
ncbi:MAG: DUF4340 domain-containing protein [Oligoflexia bacterium]|nr:DUF4340 domain-containing protein [Oligoflexia bacterium]